MNRVFAFLLVCLGLVLCSQPLFSQSVKVASAEPQFGVNFVGYAPDRVVVEFAPEVKPALQAAPLESGRTGLAQLDAILERYGARRLHAQFPGAKPKMYEGRVVDLAGWYKILFSEPVDVELLVQELEALPQVVQAQPVGIHAVQVVPNDPEFPTQWHLDQASDADMDAPEAWDLQTGNESVIVAILDTGVRYFHKDLGGANASFSDPTNVDGNIWINTDEVNGNGIDDDGNGFVDDWVGWDFVDGIVNAWPGEDGFTPDNDPRDFNGHGTHVAGIVAALNNNGYAVSSIAGGFGDGTLQPDGNGVKVMALRIGWSENYFGFEYGFVSMDFAAEALYYAADNGARIANGSWGSSNTGGLGAAMDYFIASGGLFFHAAGNSSSSVPDYLGSRTDVINVASTDQNDFLSSFSNYGTWVDISAPGTSILSTYHEHTDEVNDYIATLSGTSMASPNAAGVAALIWSHDLTQTADEVKQILFDSADDIDALNPGFEGMLGAGRVNARAALDMVGGGTGVPPTITSTPNTTATVGQPYSYDDNNTVEATGTPPITFSLVTGPAGFTVTSDGVVSWTPDATQVGSHTVEIMASNNYGSDTQTFTIVVSDVPPPPSTAYRINAGGSDYTDGNGNLFVADKAYVAGDFGYSGGKSYTISDAIDGTDDDALYQTLRGDKTSFSYLFDLDNGDYQVTCYFQEPKLSAVGDRVFDVLAEGVVVIDDLDLIAAAGGKLTAYSETFTVTVNDGQLNLDFQAVTNGALVCAIAVEPAGPVTPEPDISVSPTSVDFGQVNTGSSADQVVSISNVGTADLTVTSISLQDGNPDYSLVNPPTLPLVIAPGDPAQQVTVRFAPGAAGVSSETLVIESDDPDEATVSVALTGEGVVPPPSEPDIRVEPLSLDFGQVVVGQSASQTVEIFNDGTVDLTVNALTISGGEFALLNPPALPLVIAPSGSQSLTVQFSPTSTGVQSGDLTVDSDDPDEPSVVVSLSGEGVSAPPATTIRINAGGGDYTDMNGNLFVADKAYTAGDFGYDGGKTFSFSDPIAGTDDDALYQDMRGDKSAFSYRFDVANGDYTVVLHFMEPRYSTVGEHIFDVAAEGTVVLDDLDIVAETGGDFTALTKTFTVTVSDGTLDLDFTAVVKGPAVCALEVTGPITSSTMAAGEDQLEEPRKAILPRAFALKQNYPNPFNPSTQIAYQIPASVQQARVSLLVFDALGNRVRTLVSTVQSAGEYRVTWDGRNEQGMNLPSGIYFYRLQVEPVAPSSAAPFQMVRKMVLLK